MRTPRAVGKSGASQIIGERVERRINAVMRAVKLPLIWQMARLLRRFHADNPALMAMMPKVQRLLTTAAMQQRFAEISRTHRVHSRHVSGIERNRFFDWDDVPFQIIAAQMRRHRHRYFRDKS